MGALAHLDVAVEHGLDRFGGHRLAAVELDAGSQLEGPLLAIVADRPARRQRGLELALLGVVARQRVVDVIEDIGFVAVGDSRVPILDVDAVDDG